MSGVVAGIALACLTSASASAGTLAFESCGGAQCPTAVWTVHDDGTGLRQVTTPQAPDRGTPDHIGFSVVDSSPQWSPDGARIAFGHHFSGEDSGMWSVNRDGSGLRRILETDANPSDWSPGGLIVFSTVWPEAPGLPDVPSENPIQVPDSDVFTVREDGTGVTRIVNSP